VAHRELLAEAEFYQLAGLCELLRGRLLELEDKGERLRRLSIDTAIADTRGGFDSLLSQIYAEMEGKAAQARARPYRLADSGEIGLGGTVHTRGAWWYSAAQLKAAHGAHERACRVYYRGRGSVSSPSRTRRRSAWQVNSSARRRMGSGTGRCAATLP
jgi:hypothetical protein